MKILQINDTHEGVTKTATVLELVKKIAEQDFDLLLHCGDYSGPEGHINLDSTVRTIREHISKPYISVIGNHDLWVRGSIDSQQKRYGFPSLSDWLENYRKVLTTFKEQDVHFLDEDGPYRIDGITMVGHTGWYRHPNPLPNVKDFFHMPLGIEGDTHRFLQLKARKALDRNLGMLTEEDKKIVFVSHFPVIKVEPLSEPEDHVAWDLGFENFGGDTFIGKVLQEQYGCRHFFNGHAHQLHQGPLRYESGSDYFNPRFQIVEV